MKKKIKEFITKNLKWIILFICLIGFLAIAEDVFNKEIMSGDIIGYKLVSTFLISNFATPIAKFITNFGGAIFIAVLYKILGVLVISGCLLKYLVKYLYLKILEYED